MRARRELGSSESVLAETLVNMIAKDEPAKARSLAKSLRCPTSEVRTELLELEQLGIVTRTGRTRGTKWWLG